MAEDSCGCGCNDLPIIPPTGNPRDTVEVVGQGEIVVTEENIGNKKRFTVKRVVYAPPAIAVTGNPVREVGTVNDFTWNGNISPGSAAIIRRQITPAGADLSSSWAVSVEDVTKAVRGFEQGYHVEVEDTPGTIVQKNLGIQFYNKVYMGYSYKDGQTAGQELTEADILAFTGTLADNVKSVYGGAKNYPIPASAVQQYLYWIYEVGTSAINQILLSGLNFPIVFFPGSVPIENQNNAAISTNYVIVRSANKFGTGTLSLVMS